MIEISTNDTISIESLILDQLIVEDDLEPHEQRFYESLFLQLSTIQHFPKPETVSRIMTYSKSKDNF